MPCYHPIQAWRTKAGDVKLNKEIKDASPLRLPCGGCLGCRTSAAKAWSLRCQLELQQHQTAAFTTLTYDEKYRPATLEKRHLQLFLKRLRRHSPNRVIRFFASGEYGETNSRPHYHAILYGTDADKEADIIQQIWAKGYTLTKPVTPAAIAYVAGYTSKKIGYRRTAGTEQVDPDTGEVYTWQPPFIQMSRRPGIGGEARKFTNSWRLYAIHQHNKIPVPRFLHDAWKQQATQEDIDTLEYEKYQIRQNKQTTNLEAAEKIAQSKQTLQSHKRHI